MSSILIWLDKNPTAVASLLSALVAAFVALIVFALTQLLSQKREQTRFLTPKLEELYLLLNGMSEDNATFFKLTFSCSEGNEQACKQLKEIDELELYGHRKAKQIIMYIRLYFPKLSRIHQLLFSAQGNLNNLTWALHTKTPPSSSEVIRASGKVGHYLRLMENEIIRNRDVLLADFVFPKRYKKTTQEEVEAELPPPNGPVMS